MKPSLLERYGSTLALGLVTLFAWRLISVELHVSEEFQLLFPLRWLSFTPLAPAVTALAAALQGTAAWTSVQVACTVFGWTVVYYALRGLFYTVRSIEGPSMWVAFFFSILIAFTLFGLLVRPAFDQIAVWWKEWPAAGQNPPGGTLPGQSR